MTNKELYEKIWRIKYDKLCESYNFCEGCPFDDSEGFCLLTQLMDRFHEYAARLENKTETLGGYQPTEPIKTNPPKTLRP